MPCGYHVCGRWKAEAVPVSDQSFQYALSFHDVFIIPLDGPRFSEPAFQRLLIYLCYISITRLGGFKTTFRQQTGFFKGLSAPEQEPDVVFKFAVTHHGIAVQEPDRVTVPYFTFRFRELLVYCRCQGCTNLFIFRKLGGVICGDILVHRGNVVL